MIGKDKTFEQTIDFPLALNNIWKVAFLPSSSTSAF